MKKLKHSQKTLKSNIPKKHPLLLKKLYEKKFNQHFSGGLPPLAATHQHYLTYEPVNYSLRNYPRSSRESKLIKPAVLDIPNIGSEPFKTAFSIWADCLDELKSVTNRLNKSDGKMTREVYSLLPRLLKEEYKSPDLESWKQFYSAKIPIKGSIIVQISDIAPLVGITKRDALTATQCNAMVTAEKELKFEPLQDFVLVEPIPRKMTAGGIALPDDADVGPEIGRVVKVGPGRYLELGTLVPPDVTVGDIVYMMFIHQPLRVELAGKAYVVIRARELIAKSKP